MFCRLLQLHNKETEAVSRKKTTLQLCTSTKKRTESEKRERIFANKRLCNKMSKVAYIASKFAKDKK